MSFPQDDVTDALSTPVRQQKIQYGPWFVAMAAVLWGTTGTAQALAPWAATPLSIGLVRLSIGGIVLLVVALWRQTFRSGNRWSRPAVFWGVVGIAAYQLCFFAGVARTGVAVGTVVAIGSSPIVAGLLGWLVYRDPITVAWSVATSLAIGGCMLLVIPTGTSGGIGNAVAIDATGVLLAFGAGSSYAVYAAASKRMLADQKPDAVMAVIFVGGALLLLPVFWLADFRWLLEPAGTVVALHLGVVTVALAYVLFARGLRVVPVGTAVTLSLAEPMTASLLGILLLGETVTLSIFAGMALLFTGLLIVSLVPARRHRLR